jgi:DNA-binding FadR family transcriptional regulator
MTLRAAARSSLIDQVIEQLRGQIADGVWAVGERIPTEPELAGRLGVGRNTVRESVRALAHAGLLEIRQGSGTYVRAASELPGAVLRRLADAEIRDVYEVRRSLEVEAARLAARRRTAADVEAIRAALGPRADAARRGDADDYVSADARLHRLIVGAAHNPLLSELYDSIGAAVRQSLRQRITVAGEGWATHDALVAAIADQDPSAAAEHAAHCLDATLAALGAQNASSERDEGAATGR